MQPVEGLHLVSRPTEADPQPASLGLSKPAAVGLAEAPAERLQALFQVEEVLGADHRVGPPVDGGDGAPHLDGDTLALAQGGEVRRESIQARAVPRQRRAVVRERKRDQRPPARR